MKTILTNTLENSVEIVIVLLLAATSDEDVIQIWLDSGYADHHAVDDALKSVGCRLEPTLTRSRDSRFFRRMSGWLSDADPIILRLPS